jgi:putative hemolysin
MPKHTENQPITSCPPILGLEAFLAENPSFFKKCLTPLSRFIDKKLSFHDINRFIQTLDEKENIAVTFSQILKNFSLSSQSLSKWTQTLPETGPLIIVSNHPTGLAETIILAHAILQKRTDLKILANHMLAKIPSLKDMILPINVFNQSGLVNISSIKRAKATLAQEGILLIFPAAEIADYHIKTHHTQERKWSRLPVKLALETHTDLMQIHINGKNSLSFYVMGYLHQNLRSLMIAKELMNKRNHCFQITANKPIHLNSVPIHSQETFTRLLYWINQCLPFQKTFILKNKTAPTLVPLPPLKTFPHHETTLTKEIESLPQADLIYQFKKILAYRCNAKDIPTLLDYIQIKREETFRQVQMGTGKSTDSEDYDEHAKHLVLWDSESHHLVGGYRYQIIDCEKTVSYLNGFYDINWTPLLKPGYLIELSRSFVCVSYQKSFSSLLSLWRGLGRALFLEPKLYLVAGLVSIPHTQSSPLLLDLILEYVKKFKKQKPALSRQFKAKNPYLCSQHLPHAFKKAAQHCENFSQLALLYNQISGSDFEFPELFKLYEKMGAIPLGVSIDPDFSDCIDVLQVWDMRANIDDKLKFIFDKDDLQEMKQRYAD